MIILTLIVLLFSCTTDNNKRSDKAAIIVEGEGRDTLFSDPEIDQNEPMGFEESKGVQKETNNDTKDFLNKVTADDSLDDSMNLNQGQRVNNAVEKKELDEANEHEVSSEQQEPPAKFESLPDHSIFDGLLQSFVSSSGKVNYGGFKSKEEILDQYLDNLANNSPKADWSRQEKMAYWINAYNAFTIKRILNSYPVKSITDLDGGKTWDVKWIELGGNTYSLNNIENDILRPKFGDARIHFAVNCAAISCPPLHNQAFTSDNLDSTLETLTKKFINNSRYNQLEKSQVKVSKIFEWYKDDFDNGNIIKYLQKYSRIEIKDNASLTFNEYNWALNG